MKKYSIYIFMAAFSVFAFFVGVKIGKGSSEIKTHTLKFPLLISGSRPEGHNYLLPAGTTLYYDEAFPEGFVRYKVYVNVDGVRLEATENTNEFKIDPLSASPIVNKAELESLVKGYPLTKGELKEMLGGGTLTKEDVKEVLSDFLETNH